MAGWPVRYKSMTGRVPFGEDVGWGGAKASGSCACACVCLFEDRIDHGGSGVQKGEVRTCTTEDNEAGVQTLLFEKRDLTRPVFIPPVVDNCFSPRRPRTKMVAAMRTRASFLCATHLVLSSLLP